MAAQFGSGDESDPLEQYNGNGTNALDESSLMERAGPATTMP